METGARVEMPAYPAHRLCPEKFFRTPPELALRPLRTRLGATIGLRRYVRMGQVWAGLKVALAG